MSEVQRSEVEHKVTSAEFVAGATGIGGLPAPALAEVAFAGRSNVGKSSLLNAMMQRRGLARTSSTPGCTRQINVFAVTLANGLALNFVDLPGFGYAKVAKSTKSEWGPMLEGYLAERPTLRAVVLLVDVRRGLEADDRQLLDFVASIADAAQRNKPLEAIIATDGHVASVRVATADVHPDFAMAAIDAVRQWRYSPTLLNGRPVEVMMTVTIDFSLE